MFRLGLADVTATLLVWNSQVRSALATDDVGRELPAAGLLAS